MYKSNPASCEVTSGNVLGSSLVPRPERVSGLGTRLPWEMLCKRVGLGEMGGFSQRVRKALVGTGRAWYF